MVNIKTNPPIEIPVAASGALGYSLCTCKTTSDKSSVFEAQ